MTIPTLTELEHDALTELTNLGVSRAALRLRELVGEQVHLSVPQVLIVSRTEAANIVRRDEAAQFVAVHQAFEGDITGRALLIFPEIKSLELVRAVSGEDLALEDIIELEHEALVETGNIVLNACLGTYANELRRNLKMALPGILRGQGTDFFGPGTPPPGVDFVLLLRINFAMHKRDINGYIAMLLDLPSIVLLKTLLGEYIERAIS